MRADLSKLPDVIRRLKTGEDRGTLVNDLYGRGPVAFEPSPPPATSDAPACRHLSEDEIPGPERQARGLPHNRVWRRCAKGLGESGAVCPCIGCGPRCGQYERPAPACDEVAAGVVVGCYGWPRLAEAQIHTIRETCGASTPILLADDGSPATADLARLAENLGVDFAGTLHRLGHYPGDLSALRKGLEWAQEKGLAVVVKLSMRLLLTWPGWLAKVAELVLNGPAETVVPQLTEGSDRTLYFRTEAVAMRVAAWAAPAIIERLQAERLGVTELHFNDIIHRNFAGRFVHWPGFTPDRYRRSEGAIWHCTHSHHEYAAWFARFGLRLDDDFHTAGHDKVPGWKAG
jgi:hypothetical protein